MTFTGKIRLPTDKLIATVSAFFFILWLLAPAPAMAAEKASVKGTFVNLRAGPSTGTKVVGRALQGESLDVLSQKSGWCQVKKGSLTCWIAGWLVDIKESAAPQGNTAAKLGGTAAPAFNGTPYEIEVVGNPVNIRSGPGTGYNTIGQAHRGDDLRVTDRSGSWYKVAAAGGPGWMYSPLTKVTQASAPVTSVSSSGSGSLSSAVVSGSDVNIRSGPGTGFDVVSRAGLGDRLQLLDKSSDWYKVKTSSGNTGWIASWLVGGNNPSAPSSTGSGAGGITPGTTGGGSKPVISGNGSTTNQSGSVNTPSPSGGVNTPNPSGGGAGQGSSVLPPPKDSAGTPAAGAKAGMLKAVSGRVQGTGTVITVVSDGTPIKYSATTMSNPSRLVLDIQGLVPGSCQPNIYMNSQLVDQIRVGLYGSSPAVTRVVVDLKAMVSYKTTLSSGDSKLEVSLTPKGTKTVAGATIVIDPGHGGSDPGAIGPGGLQEKTVNLDIALKTAQILRAQGATVILTRTDDTYVDLYERPEIANRNNADLFVSIHSNANDNRSIGGTSTYYVREPLEGMGQVAAEGMSLAKSIQSSLMGSLQLQDWGVLKANYVVLLRTKMPAALAEVAYLSNPDEEKLLGDDGFRLKAASAIADGIANYLKGN